MKRFSISIPHQQYEFLVKLSKKYQVSIGEIIRRIFERIKKDGL
jgi:predicted CopG family antitoxin